MYRLEFTAAAQRDLAKLDPVLAQRVLKKLRWLGEHFEQIVPEPLGQELKGAYKLRIGPYRAIYRVAHRQRKITVHLIGHRSEIYKLRE